MSPSRSVWMRLKNLSSELCVETVTDCPIENSAQKSTLQSHCAARFGRLPSRQSLAGGLLFLQTQCPVSLHQGMNVAGAFIDHRRLAVAQITLDRIIIRVAVRAVNFDGHRRGLLAAHSRLPFR